MPLQRKYRYPGSKPFVEAEKELFFGREDDVRRLSEMIRVEKLLVLYGRSGLGKSSLLNAGVIPALNETGDFDVCTIRFGSYQQEAEEYMPPITKTLRSIRIHRSKESFLRKIKKDTHSIWQSLKGIQIAEKLDKEFVLIFDQFEELFTYPDKDIRDFKEKLAEIISEKIPHEFRQELKKKMAENPEILSKEEMELLYKPLKVKVVLAIRSDKMSLLNRLNQHIPTILQKVYELRPLKREQAEDAILNPAEIPNDYQEFESPCFEYEDESLDKILDYLTRNNEKDIEPFQLQTVCQYVEENIVIERHDVSISPDDLGNMEDIYQNYYDNQIRKIDNPVDRQLARRLIEEDMIFDEEERRLSIYEGQIFSKGVNRELLEKLTDTHLIRAEPSPEGGFSYEISHDTLVPPILKSKQERVAKEEEKKLKEEEERLKTEAKKDKKKKRAMVILFFFGLVGLVGLGAWIFYTFKWTEQKKELQRKTKELGETVLKLQEKNEKYEELKANYIQSSTATVRGLQIKNDTLRHKLERSTNESTAFLDSMRTMRTIFISQKQRLDNCAQCDKSINDLKGQIRADRFDHYKIIRDLNNRLTKEIDLIQRDNYHKQLKNGILQDYKKYEEELKKSSP
ncbi:MAG: hypothetical protein ACI85I_002693, partial [Arenicella sp.]